MGIRTVRFNDEDERTLAAVRRRTGLPVAEILRRGLRAYDTASREEVAARPYDVYRRLDLGSGGSGTAPAKKAKAAIAKIIAAKHRR